MSEVEGCSVLHPYVQRHEGIWTGLPDMGLVLMWVCVPNLLHDGAEVTNIKGRIWDILNLMKNYSGMRWCHTLALFMSSLTLMPRKTMGRAFTQWLAPRLALSCYNSGNAPPFCCPLDGVPWCTSLLSQEGALADAKGQTRTVRHGNW